MQIIKQGRKIQRENKKCFLCDFCGCEFIAEEKEYVKEQYYDYGYQYIARCPNCNQRVYEYKFL